LVYFNPGEENILRVLENRVLRRIFDSKRDETAGGWRRQHNEELCNLYASPNIAMAIEPRRMRWTGHVARMLEKRNAYKILVGKLEEKRLIGRPRCRWEDNIGVYIRETGREGVG
jgi:hypothetical protein